MEYWRGKIRDLDAATRRFEDSRRALIEADAATLTERERAERAALLRRADGLHKQLVALHVSLLTARKWLGMPKYGATLGAVQFAVPVGFLAIVGSATLITSQLLAWLRDLSGSGIYDKLVKAGVDPAKAAKIEQGRIGAQGSKIFGFDVRWLLALGAAWLAFPYVHKRLLK